jgi:hypothetical protein
VLGVVPETGSYTLPVLARVGMPVEAVVPMPALLDTVAVHSIVARKGPVGVEHRVVAASAEAPQPRNQTPLLRATSILWERL